MTEKKRRIGGDGVPAKTDRLSFMASDVRLLLTEMLTSKDIAKTIAPLARLYRRGWSQHEITVTDHHGDKDFGEMLAEAAQWIGDKINRVRSLKLGNALGGYISIEAAQTIARFDRVTRLEVGEGHIRLVGRILRENRLPQLRWFVFKEAGLQTALVDALIHSPEALRETLVGWSCETMSATQMLLCPVDWLGRLEALHLERPAADAKATTLLLQKCSQLRTLTFSQHWSISTEARLDDDWVAATFTGGCSRELTNVNLASSHFTFGVKGLALIAKHCPKMVEFIAPKYADDDRKGEDWDALIPVFQQWSATLRDLMFPVFRGGDATLAFFEQTRLLCPLVEYVFISWGTILAGPVRDSGAIDRWNSAHPLLLERLR